MLKKSLLKTLAICLSVTSVLCFTSISASAAVIDDEFAVSSDNTTEILPSEDTTIPSKYSSKDLGYVTEMKQQLYNDCWAYAGLGAFESKLLKQGFDITSMSVNHLNAWATTFSNGKGWQRTYTSDGYAEIALGYLTSWQGGIEESVTGAIDLNSVIAGDLVDTSKTRYGTTEVEYLTKTDPDSIKKAIMENGGVYSAYAHAPSCLSSDRLSYYMPDIYNGSYTGHAIEIVGWNNNYPTRNFNGTINRVPSNKGAWLVKNSWGENNSEGGYFWISYEDKFIFSDKYRPSYAIKSVVEINDNIRLEQNEIFGSTYEFGYVERDEITYINQFDFSSEYNTLDKVVFETRSKNADYSIYYVPSVDKTPVQDKTQWVKLFEDTLDYEGYHCADIEDFELPQGNGSIAVEINTSKANTGLTQYDENYVANTIGVGEWLVKSNGFYTFINDSKYGDSFIYYDNTMTDLMQWYKDYNNDEIGGTFVIKAITTKSNSEVNTLGDVNLDGAVNILDATLIQKYIVGLSDLSDTALLNADYNQNGKIEVTDATAIQKFTVGLNS